jgi:Predicted nucleotide-binding protein containing TIR-like domain
MKPTLFIGSSSESKSLELAYAAQVALQDVAEVTVWNQGIFDVSKFVLESILDALDDAQFGLFVFAPEDVTHIRDEKFRTTRDNVVFELGLFIGRLGRNRCFIIMPHGIADFHLPTDLLGLNAATFDPNHRHLEAALGPACFKIRQAIQKAFPTTSEASQLNLDHKLVMAMLVPEAERNHLSNLYRGTTKDYKGRGSLRSEMRHLRDIGLVCPRAGRDIGDMKTFTEFDLAEYVELTDLGTQWAKQFA